MSTFSHGGFGAGQRLSASSFIVLGLLTFWVYSVWYFSKVLKQHLQRRWQEMQQRPDLQPAQTQDLTGLYQRGFSFRFIIPGLAMGLFGLDAILIVRWFIITAIKLRKFSRSFQG